MKTMGTFLLAPLVMGIAMAVFVVSGMADESSSALQYSLAIVGALAIALIVGALLNFAIFAPVYWLLGRLHHRKAPTKTNPPDNA